MEHADRDAGRLRRCGTASHCGGDAEPVPVAARATASGNRVSSRGRPQTRCHRVVRIVAAAIRRVGGNSRTIHSARPRAVHDCCGHAARLRVSRSRHAGLGSIPRPLGRGQHARLGTDRHFPRDGASAARRHRRTGVGRSDRSRARRPEPRPRRSGDVRQRGAGGRLGGAGTRRTHRRGAAGAQCLLCRRRAAPHHGHRQRREPAPGARDGAAPRNRHPVRARSRRRPTREAVARRELGARPCGRRRRAGAGRGAASRAAVGPAAGLSPGSTMWRSTFA